MLIIVKNRYAHSFAQFSLDVKTFGRLDVLKVNPAERGFERGNDFNEFFRIQFVDFDIEAIDAGKLLEQDRLAFHDRFGGQRSDRAQAENGGAIGDHANQVGTRGHVACLGRITDYFVTCRSHARRIGQRKIPLVDQPLGRGDRDFPGPWQTVIVERGFSKRIFHGAPGAN